MPGLQALAGVPSFGGGLGQALGGGLSQGISAGLTQMFQQKQQQKTGNALAEYLGEPEMADALGRLPEELQKVIATASLKQKEDQKQEKITLQDSFNQLSGLSDEVGFSVLPAKFHTEESAAQRAEFETLKGPLFAAIRKKLFPTGILTNQKMDYINKELLPAHGDRTEVKKRKLKALGDQLGLDTSSLNLGKTSSPKSSDFVLMKDPNGVVRKVPKNQAIQAQQAGGKLVQ